MKQLKNYINGEFCGPESDQWMDNFDPATGGVYSLVPKSTAKDVQKAVEAAEAAFPKWSNLTAEKRSDYIRSIAGGIEKSMVEFAETESTDNGKPLSLALTVDIPRAVSNFRFYANAITQFESEAHETTGRNTMNFTLRKPLGVVGCISPWNLPLYLFTWKIAPALAAGNCVVAKPSEITPVTAYLLSKVCAESELPKGVLNIVHGTGKDAGQAIVEHPRTLAISFTGGTKTGRQIAKTVAPMFKKFSLELGGKNPNVIFADCNYEQMLKTTLKSSFSNQGEICLCGSRIFVEHKIYEQFKKDFIGATKKLKVGPPEDADSDLGALVSRPHFEKVMGYLKDVKEQDAEILLGGNPVKVKGYEHGNFLEPTIIEVKTNRCKLNQEEIFGPVVTMMPFHSEEEVIEMANDVRYGLSSSVWTGSLDRAMRMGNGLQAGIIWINTWMNRDLRTPFGGVKESGMGREGGFEALRFFTEPKNVCIQYEGNPDFSPH